MASSVRLGAIQMKPLLVWFLSLLIASGALARSPESHHRTVLALYPTERWMPANVDIERALRDGLGVDTNPEITYLSEFLDSSRFESPQYEKLVTDFLRSKYQSASIDVVVVFGSRALELVRSENSPFHGIPVVFCGVGREELHDVPPPAQFVGVPVTIDPRPTIELASRLQPEASEIVIVTGTSVFDRYWEGKLRRAVPTLGLKFGVRYLSGLPLEDVLRELARLPSSTIVLTSTFYRDGANHAYISAVAVKRMAKISAAPVYNTYSTAIGNGVVGGYVFTMSDIGRQASELVKRLFDGEKLPLENVPSAPPFYYVVDWNQLRRWHFSEDSLPFGTVVEFRELDPWQKYKSYVFFGAGLLGLQSLLIAALAMEARKRKKSESELKNLSSRLIHAQENERRRIARDLHDDLSQRMALLAVHIEDVGGAGGILPHLGTRGF
jgi:hypothetical protein